MERTIVIDAPGGIDQLQLREIETQKPGKGEILIRHEAIGVNFLDIYHRKGIYTLPAYPAVLGVEGTGIVEAVGDGVTGFKPGDRIVYAGSVGAYATTRLLAADRAIHLSDGIDSRLAGASMLKGMTAHMLLAHTYKVGEGTTLLMQAAAGGLGSILIPWAKHLGATVIGTVSSAEKAETARRLGADHVVIGRDADIVEEVKALTRGRGVDVAYDGIGGAMLARSIDCVRAFGLAATIGQAAGPVPPVAVERLRPGKSLAHPSIMAFILEPACYAEAAATIAMLQKGIAAAIAVERPLDEAGKVHALLESGALKGGAILVQ